MATFFAFGCFFYFLNFRSILFLVSLLCRLLFLIGSISRRVCRTISFGARSRCSGAGRTSYISVTCCSIRNAPNFCGRRCSRRCIAHSLCSGSLELCELLTCRLRLTSLRASCVYYWVYRTRGRRCSMFSAARPRKRRGGGGCIESCRYRS